MLLIDLILQSTLAGMIGNVINKCSGGLWGFTQPDNATIEDLVAKIELLLKSQDIEKEQLKETILDIFKNTKHHEHDLIKSELQTGVTEHSENVLLSVMENERKKAQGHHKKASQAAYHIAILSQFHDIEKAIEHLRLSINLYPQNFKAINELGRLLRRMGKIEEAENHFSKILTSSPSSLDHAKALGNLGLIEKSRGKLEKAKRYHQKALDLFTEQKNQHGIAKQMSNLGLIARRQNDFKKALSLHKESLEINEKLDIKLGIARQNGNIGLLERKQNNLDTAEFHTKIALEIHEDLGRKDGIARQRDNLGLIEIRRHNYDRAEAHLKCALAINESINRIEGMINQHVHLGFLKQKQNDYKMSHKYFQNALALATEIDAKPRIDQILNALQSLPSDQKPIENERGKTLTTTPVAP